MTKQEYTSFADKVHALGLKVTCRANGGNQLFYESENERLVPTDDALISVAMSHNYAAKGQRPFNITKIPWDNLDTAFANDVDFVNAIDLLKNLGVWDSDMEEFFKKSTRKVDLYIPVDGSNAGMGAITKETKDSEGNVVKVDSVTTGQVAYIH